MLRIIRNSCIYTTHTCNINYFPLYLYSTEIKSVTSIIIIYKIYFTMRLLKFGMTK